MVGDCGRDCGRAGFLVRRLASRDAIRWAPARHREIWTLQQTINYSAMASKEKTATEAKPAKRILFIHPDLGIGGAERLVVDAAVGLQDRGHSVTIYTSHCDPRHCFDEARNGMCRPDQWIFLFLCF